jgi:hypothetical protein
MCMGGACKKCAAACKAPEPKQSASKGGPVKSNGLDVAKRNAAEAAVVKARDRSGARRS